jgi:hypothetical protein|tara:strand:- start:18213 stop:20213 length:2001 start_codon:yes stop_codon:yes gene_type:complete
MSYFGYKRGDKPRVNWGGLAEKFSQDLLAEKASRDQRKKSIADAQAKELAELDKQAVTPETSVNGEIIRSSNDARQAYLTNVRLMRRGLIKPSTARAGQQRLADGYKMYNQYMTTWGEEYQKFVTDRTGTGSALDDFIQQDRFKFGNLEQWGLVVDPNNMNLLMGSKDKDGNIDMSKTVDMANIVNTNQDFHDEFDATEFNKNLGTEITGIIESSEVVEILGGEANVLQVYEDYYAMGDPSKFIDAVESEDFTKVQEMNADAASDGALTNYGQAYYNIFKTINSALGAVNVRDRASALEQIGYELVDVSDDVDLETLQSDAKYNKEGSKEIYVYRDEQNLLQPYLSESQNRDFERDGLDRALAAKDFKISKQRIIRDRSDSDGNGSSKDFAPAPWMNVIKARFPGKVDSFRAATGVIAAATNVNAGTITIDSDGNINGLGGTSSTDRTGVPNNNAEWLSMSTREKNEVIDVLMGMDVNGYIGTTQANMPQASGEYEDMRRAITKGVNDGAIDFSTTASYENTLAELEELNYSIYSAPNLLNKSGIYGLAGNFKNADTKKKMDSLKDDAQGSLRKVSELVGNLSKNMSISQAGRNQARDLQREIDNFISSITLNTAEMKYDFAGTIGGSMVYGTIYGGKGAEDMSQETQFEFSSLFEQVESIINNIK